MHTFNLKVCDEAPPKHWNNQKVSCGFSEGKTPENSSERKSSTHTMMNDMKNFTENFVNVGSTDENVSCRNIDKCCGHYWGPSRSDWDLQMRLLSQVCAVTPPQHDAAVTVQHCLEGVLLWIILSDILLLFIFSRWNPSWKHLGLI